MRLRPRSDPEPPDAAARVLALLTPRAAGWVPPPPAPPAGDVEHVPTQDEPLQAAPLQDAPLQAAPSEAAPLGLPPALRNARWDPGGRGAVALVVAALLAALVAGGLVLRGRPQEVVVPEVVASGAPLPGASLPESPLPGTGPRGAPGSDVVVAVAGKVARPGLVRLPAGSRVDDAVRAAGGVLPGADAGLLNLARLLVDGEQVLVGVDPPPGAAPAGSTPGSAAGPVDLNAATAADLDALPGIGPVLAQRIVDWRTEHGRFASVEQLREVTGIGESKYADLEAKVTV